MWSKTNRNFLPVATGKGLTQRGGDDTSRYATILGEFAYCLPNEDSCSNGDLLFLIKHCGGIL